MVAFSNATGTATSTWTYWVASSTSSTTTCDSTTIWNTWTTTHYATGDEYTNVRWVRPGPVVQETPEQVAAREARQREAERQRALEARKAEVAKKRAKHLMLSLLNPAQRAQFKKNGWFVVQGGKTGKSYRINGNAGCAGNIHLLADNDNEKAVSRLCVHGPHHLPLYDHLIAQKLMIETDEDELNRLANHTRFPTPQRLAA